MKQWIRNIVNFYNQNAAMHSFVSGLEGAVVGALTSWGGGIPVNKSGWIVLGCFVGKAAWGYIKHWLQVNAATVGTQVK